MLNVNLRNQMELLAPAGDWDALLAGLAGGADAIYLGGSGFSARQYATNFDLPQLEAATNLLHLHGKKIFVTVNTLINDQEISLALEYLADLWNLGVDAVIIQDLGLIKLARAELPQLELHASTQMTVHNTEGALFLKQLGLKRVVLARELTEDEVKTIAGQSGLEVEVFIHGALCICYSGQCLMSSIIGGRSGNRGRCAQPCRMSYQLLKEKELIATAGNYLLSPKDLALASLIPELHQAGVKALKIEGRMKRPEYVYTVVRIYRELLDRYAAAPESYALQPRDHAALDEVFNRGFSTGYFGGNRNLDLMSFTRPNNRGVFLGRIQSNDPVTKRSLLTLEADLEVGDEVEVWISQGGRVAVKIGELYDERGVRLTQAKVGMGVGLSIPGKVYPGDRVFKVFSIRIQESTKEAIGENPALKIPCVVRAEGSLSQPLQLNYRDDQGNLAEVASEIPLQAARNRPLTRETLAEQLGRLGNTPFVMQELELDLPPDLMLPVSELNRMRREAITVLTRERLLPWRRDPIIISKNLLSRVEFKLTKPAITNEQTTLNVWVADLAGVAAAAAAGADLVYAGGDELTAFSWDENLFKEAISQAHRHGTKLVIAMPRINREGQRDRWWPLWQMALAVEPDGVMVSDLGSLYLAQQEPKLRRVYLNYTLNFFNTWAVAGNSAGPIQQVTLSPELTLGQVRELAISLKDYRLECLVHGPLELMVSEYCPIKASNKNQACSGTCRQDHYYLKDRLQYEFPVVPDQFCRMHLLNSVDLCLYEELSQFVKLTNLALRLELKVYNAHLVGKIVAAYHRALRQMDAGDQPTGAAAVITEFKDLTGRGITKGHYFRGVE